MQIEGWKYYNHAAVPTVAPHEKPDLTPLNNGTIWRIGKRITLLARWTDNFDCGFETSWWYVIKDTPFDIAALKSKRRYEIRKGRKNFEVEKINPKDVVDDIYRCACKAFQEYPKKYRPTVTLDKVAKDIDDGGEGWVFFGARNRYGELSGYAYLIEHCRYAEFVALKTDPDEEKNGINAALVDAIMTYYNEKLSADNSFYICDGMRSTRHETHFQDYLEKYFDFRKAFCNFHIRLRFFVKVTLYILRPFKRIMNKSENRIVYNMVSLMNMVDIANEGLTDA